MEGRARRSEPKRKELASRTIRNALATIRRPCVSVAMDVCVFLLGRRERNTCLERAPPIPVTARRAPDCKGKRERIFLASESDVARVPREYYDIKLTGFNPTSKIKVIKEVRAMTGAEPASSDKATTRESSVGCARGRDSVGFRNRRWRESHQVRSLVAFSSGHTWILFHSELETRANPADGRRAPARAPRTRTAARPCAGSET